MERNETPIRAHSIRVPFIRSWRGTIRLDHTAFPSSTSGAVDASYLLRKDRQHAATGSTRTCCRRTSGIGNSEGAGWLAFFGVLGRVPRATVGVFSSHVA